MRPEIIFPIFSDISSLPGVGPKTKVHYERLCDGGRILDLIYHRPISIIDRRLMPPLFQMQHGNVITAIVKVDAHIPPKNKNSHAPYRVICSNETGGITLIFFGGFPDYLKNNLPVGHKRVISGRAETFGGSLQMAHPDYIVPESLINDVLKVEPVYPLTSGLGQKAIYKTIHEAIKRIPRLPEWIEPQILVENKWKSWKDSIDALHNPVSDDDLNINSTILRRLAYDEILAHQLTLKMNRKLLHTKKGRSIKGDGSLQKALLESLPFALTNGQKEVIIEINADQESTTRMARLLQGDVGSGKTVVALMAALNAVESGAQVSIMAPTEILAIQHYKWISSVVAGLSLSPWERKFSPIFSSKIGKKTREGYSEQISDYEVINNPLPNPLPKGEGTSRIIAKGSLNKYNEKLLEYARELRGNHTDVGKKLWNLLRNKRFFGYKFYREMATGEYICDFVCRSKKLVIELDGGGHATRKEYDARRTEFLNKEGYRVVRFWNNEINENTEGVLLAILSALKEQEEAHSPSEEELPHALRIALLTGSTKQKEREEILTHLASGEMNIIIGTHALFQEKVKFHDLGLVVIDEQHRFGVKQRSALAEKGDNADILIMTATPIPRSLTMAIYGDMECSRLTEKPQGRKEIDTRVVPSSKIGAVIEGLKRVIAKGEKVYWICPLVEESEKSELAAVDERYASFKKIFGDKVGVVHGRMKSAERQEAMLKFRDGEVDILIATTVIEVGVDVPSATTIIIEHADRFGLSQLHQLRGRVGRNDKQSSCVLIYYSMGDVAAQRLGIMRESNDGFRLAEEDLKIRGGGDILGEKQSGLPSFRIADLYEHTDLFQLAGRDAARQLEVDPDFKSPRGKALRLLMQLFEYDLHEYS